ncbi:MAG TPA: serine/threonine-protein kinase [Kofleriaceae bacterium]|nr:serine/threonine-protein kinase [Kofleriaceae bacterium]
MEEPLQKSLERYDVLDRIAVGGMAEVFLAKAYGAHGFEKTLAIKRILPELASDPEFAARFIAEAKVAVRLSHANVVQVFDFGRIGESLFIAMEFVDGLDLAAMLRKFKDEHRQVTLPAAFHIAIEIIRALDFAHSHNVVHRDVSPSNILISRAGEVKIADFGIAIAASPHRGGGPGPRKVMGKWRYMSPEQTRGDTLDTRSDLFSAASVMFELFTGEKLFPGEESEEIIKNIESMAIPRMSTIRPGLPSRLDDVLALALARKPIDRPSRPASILRSLIELSYESSIMATALDVAEAVATVIPAKRAAGRGALDDVIRRQLADQSIARLTAVTDGKPPVTETIEVEPTSTGLFRKLDSDGLARLEEADQAVLDQAPNEAPEPELREAVQQVFLDATKDPDRRTEVGGPPTGQVPKSELSGQMPRQRGRQARSPAIWIALAAGLAGGGALATWRITRNTSHASDRVVVTPPPVDASVPEAMGTLELDSIPTGAMVTIADRPLGAAPRSARVSSGVKIHVKLDLKGFQVYEDDLSVEPGKTVVLRPRLSPAPAVLHVETTPPGATITLDDQVLGSAPLTRPITVPKKAELTLARSGFETVRLKIDLRAGEQTDVVRELKELQKFGVVLVTVSGSANWGYVWFKGRNLGQNYTIAGGQTQFKLPVGRQQLRIVHPKASPKIVVVDVVERGQTKVTVPL